VYVRHLSLTDFRSYAGAELAFDPGPSVLIGPNGQGKTNVVEAIGYLATLGSHRVSGDTPLVRAGAERAIVRASVVHEGRELLIDLEITPGKANRARLNRNAVPRVREILGALRTVLFAPEDLAIVRGDPSERRRFLDEVLVAQTPRFAAVKSDYDRALKQRNTLLKSAGGGRRSVDLSVLDIWDGHLIEHGAALMAGRLALVSRIAPYVEQAYGQVSNGGGPAQIAYTSTVPVDVPEREALAAAMREALVEGRARELERGITLVGPHRDDLTLQLGPLPARGYASHGESWSYALALKLASYELLRSDGPEPVLLLDDVFAELDASRRDQLAQWAAGATQTIVTAAVGADVPKILQGVRFEVGDGQVWRVG
jgi:DNA replication and repair protein RecF